MAFMTEMYCELRFPETDRIRIREIRLDDEALLTVPSACMTVFKLLSVPRLFDPADGEASCDCLFMYVRAVVSAPAR